MARRYANRTSSTSSWPEYFKPTFTQKLTFQYALEGEPVVFTCSLVAYPTPEMTWFHNNRPIPTGLRRVIRTENDLHQHSSSLEVKRVQGRDSGSYRFLAVNSEGSAESSASLHVIQKGQDERYLEFLKRAEQTWENMGGLGERKEERIKVGLRFTGSPFNKKQDVEQKGMVRTIHFRSASPVRRADYVYNDEWSESKFDIKGCLSVGESFLDEETKMKLQRLREARKIFLEKKKLSLLEVSSEVNSVTVRSEDIVRDVPLSREEGKRGFGCEFAEDRDRVDKSAEGVTQNPYSLPNQIHQNREPPSSVGATGDEDLQTENSPDQETFLEESLQKGYLYEHVLVDENLQAVERFEESVTSTMIREPSPFASNEEMHGYKSRGICESPDKVSQVLTAYPSESLDTFVDAKDTEDVDSGGGTQRGWQEGQCHASTKAEEFKAEHEEKTRSFENYFQKHPQRCPPSFLQDIESQEVYEGDSCKFVCHFQGYPQPIVTWYSNEMPIPRSQGFTTHTFENYSTLTFPSVQPHHGGSVTCVLFNQYGTVKATSMLTVRAKPRYESQPHKVPVWPDYTDEEEELALVFDQARRIHPSFSQERQEHLHMLKTHLPEIPSADRELLSFPVEIQITAATPTPEQNKECRELFELEPEVTPRDQAIQSPKHKFIFSSDITNEPPKMLQEMPRSASCREGNSVMLECLISGEPQPGVMWFHNGVLVKPNQKFEIEEVNCSYRLYINDVSSQDSGRYQCVAQNDSGIAESILDLTVESITYREYSQLENESRIYAQYSKNQQTQVQGEPVRTHFYDNTVGPFAAQSNIKEYTIREYFQSLETVGELEKKNEVYCLTTVEKLSKSMQHASRPTDIEKPHRMEFLQCQDEEHIGERSQSLQAEATIYPFVDDFSKANIRNKVRDDVEHHGPDWRNMKGHPQSDYVLNIHSKRTSDTVQDVEDSPVPTYEEALEEERYYPGKKVKHKVIAFEKLQRAERGVVEKRRTKKSFVTAPQKKWDNREFSLTQNESGSSNMHRSEEVASHTEADSSNIIMDLKQLSSQAHEEFEIEERGRQEEILPLDQEKFELKAPVTFDLKQFHSQIESTGMNFQGLANGQQDKSSLKTQQPASEMANPEDVVFDLKQMYSHIEDPGEVFQGQETESKQETCHEEQISIYQSFQYAQEENTAILKPDHVPESFSEVVHGEAWALFQTPSAGTEEANVSETGASVENGDKSFISQLKRAASEEECLEDHEMEDGPTLKPAFGVTQGYEGTLENPRGAVHGADAPHRRLSLSQDLPFLMTGEQQDLKEQLSESTEASGEETYHEVHVQSEISFSTMEEEKREKSLLENLPRLEEAQTTKEGESETSLTQYLLAEGKYEVPEVRDTKHKAQLVQSDSITSMEVEEVTFNTVYEYYNQKQESLGRPYSPESDISIDVGSTSSEDLSELDQFYSPPSSVENLESPKSPDLYFKPSDRIEQPVANPRAEENGERYSTPSEGEIPERYSTPSGEALERYSTPPGEALERYSTPPGEALERYSTPPGEALERYSTPPGEALERYSTPPGEALERFFTPPGENLKRGFTNLSKLEREDSTANEHFHTPTDERSSPYETWRSDSFGTPNEAVEPKDNEMPPSFIEPLSRRKIYENTTLGFIIEVEGLPVPGVKWYRNRSLLEPDDRIKMERVGNVCSLEIANIQKGDGGEYLCHAVNIIGEAKSFAIVDIIPQEERAVALPPPVTHQHIMEFDMANSNSSRTPSPQEIVLEVELSEKDVKEFEKQVKIVTVPEFTPDHKSMIVSLDILPLSLVDPSAESQGQEGREFKIDLEAFEMPPRFITPICDFRIPENSSAVFKCSVIGIPPPEVRWYKEYMCIEPDDTKYVISEEKGSHSLRIRDVGPSDCATYRCRALNSAGEAICRGFLTMGESQVSAMATRTSKVTLSSQKEELVLRSRYADSFFEFQVVDGPPRFIKGISDCHAPLGTAAYFQCLVRGSPRPTVSWYKDGKLVQGSRFSAEESGIGFHNLFITGLLKGDEGEYSCVATNNSGMARSSAILTLS